MGAGRRPGRSPNRPTRRGPSPSRNTGTGVGADHSGFQRLLGGLEKIKRDRDEQRNAASNRHRDGLTIPPRREEFNRDRFNNTVTALGETRDTPENNRRWGTDHFDRNRFNHVVNAARGPESGWQPVRRRPEPIRGRIQDPTDPTRYNEPRPTGREPHTVRPGPTRRDPRTEQRNAAQERMRRGGRKGGRRR